MAGKGGKRGGSIIIRKEEIVGGGHHGGAWKVAYADFVTAMMAFFLLMWLLNATTEEQRKGLADYFAPSNLMSHASSGTGQPFGGHTPFDEGSLASDRGVVSVTPGKQPQVDPDDDENDSDVVTASKTGRSGEQDKAGPRQFARTDPAPTQADQVADAAAQHEQMGTHALSGADPATLRQAEQATRAKDSARRASEAEIREQRGKDERAAFEKAAQEIREAVRNDPGMRDLLKQLSIDMTPEGMRIQLLDEDRMPMFTTGSAVPNDRAKLLLRKITPVLLRLPEAISLSGHTDAAPFASPSRTNWELSTERANVTRQLLVEGGLPESRIRTVTGHADRDPLLPGDPMAAANRRIAIIVLRDTGRETAGGAQPTQPRSTSPSQTKQ